MRSTTASEDLLDKSGELRAAEPTDALLRKPDETDARLGRLPPLLSRLKLLAQRPHRWADQQELCRWKRVPYAPPATLPGDGPLTGTSASYLPSVLSA